MPSPTATRNGHQPTTKADGALGEIGDTGLKQSGGTIREEWLPRLQGKRATKVYGEMGDNDQVVGAVLHAIDTRLRRVEWSTTPADDTPRARELAEWADTLRDDMSHSWSAFMSEVTTMLPYGFAPHEVCYKLRTGHVPDAPGESSRYTDGLMGWRKLPVRAQESLEGWLFDDTGGLAGVRQRRRDGALVTIPITKLALFRTSTRKGNPEGRSILRTAYRAYHFKKRVEEYEAIGVERDLAGIPSIGVPEALLASDAPAHLKAALEGFKDMGRNLRNDEQACVIYPLEYDRNGNPRYKVELMASPGNKAFKTGEIIERWSRYIAMAVLADVILLGHEKVGSEALARTKAELFTMSLDAWMEGIAQVFNTHLLPRLFALNGLPPDLCPEYTPAPVTEVNMLELVQSIAVMSGAGAALFPNPELEVWLADKAGIPAELVDVTRGAPE